ncbi:MAG: hypothetical protein H6878_02850 [Rhodobiaceae bacterium]|nr:hypothetical protein [Rhodobiaceae bacterium]MCC0053535.1 hypothetical protein [Rhodobiaceae bacterium]
MATGTDLRPTMTVPSDTAWFKKADSDPLKLTAYPPPVPACFGWRGMMATRIRLVVATATGILKSLLCEIAATKARHEQQIVAAATQDEGSRRGSPGLA